MILRLLLLLALLPAGLGAQIVVQPDDFSQALSLDASTQPNTWQYTWYGKAGRNYLIQTSYDLQTWTFFPNFNPRGNNATLNVSLTADGSATLFIRAIEFDPSQPVSAAEDTDGNGLPDAWEMFYFGHLGVDPKADPDNDGLTNLQEFRTGTSPLNSDTDGDGIPDGIEVRLGTNPTAAAQADTDNRTQLKVTKPQN